MPTDPLTGSRYPASTAAPNVPQDIQNAVIDLSINTCPPFATTAARDAAYSAYVSAGGTLSNGRSCWTDDVADYWDRIGGAWVQRSTPTAWQVTQLLKVGSDTAHNVHFDAFGIVARNNGALSTLGFGGCQLASVGTPTSSDQAANKGYVDGLFAAASPDWINATYQSGWTTDTTHGPHARYRKLSNGQVEVQGAVKSGVIGSASPVFQLPVGYRPGDLLVTGQLGNDALARVDFRADGTVAVISGSTAAYTTVNWTFYANN